MWQASCVLIWLITCTCRCLFKTILSSLNIEWCTKYYPNKEKIDKDKTWHGYCKIKVNPGYCTFQWFLKNNDETPKKVYNSLSPNSDQDQFSLNNIHTLSRDLVMRINKMNTYCFALICYQILSTHSLRKYIKITLENLYVDIMGLKGIMERYK